jgi:ATP phosphoribosyltransferase regulatory subunit
MTAEGATDFEALENQAARLTSLFAEAGYERVAPSLIQPASLFLDRIGEALRTRTYVFTDPNGEELCLRPEMTIPVSRVFLERGAGLDTAKFCYSGPAFRIQQGNPDPLRPREFRQAGIESYGASGQDADLEVIGLTVEGLRRNGVNAFTLKLGHIGVLTALLAALDMPQRWRERLSRAFWRSGAFSKELSALADPKGRLSPAIASEALTEAGLLAALDARGIPMIGLRRPAEIVKRLQDKAADLQGTPLPQSSSRLLQTYLRQQGGMDETLQAIETLFKDNALKLESVIGDLRNLYRGLLEIAGSNRIAFDAAFGRHFEYYSGMVFQIEIEGAGIAGQIAGGGRYDGLIRALSGGARDVTAVGAAVHTERMLAASRR